MFAFTVKLLPAGNQLSRHVGDPGLCINSSGSVLIFSPFRQVYDCCSPFAPPLHPAGLMMCCCYICPSLPVFIHHCLLACLKIAASIYVSFCGSFKLSANLSHCFCSVCQLGLLMNMFGFDFCTKSVIINSI